MVQYQQDHDDGGGGGGPTLVAPMAVKPQLVRPKAMRPSAAMLAKIAQDFQDNPPPVYDQEEQPPVSSIEISNVPYNKNSCKNMEDDASDVSSSTTTTATSYTNSTVIHTEMSKDGKTFKVNAKPTVKEAKKRLRARRTMSATNLGAAIFGDEDSDEDDDKKEEKKQDNSALPQGLVKPMAIRPKALKASQSQTMLNQISHDFANLPTTQIAIPPQRAPSAPPMQSHQPHQRAPSVAPQPVIHTPKPVRAQPQRPRVRRQSSSRQKPSWYHRVAAKNKLGSIQEDPFLSGSEDEAEEPESARVSPLTMTAANSYYMNAPWERIQAAKKDLLQELNRVALLPDIQSNSTPAIQAAVQTLIQNYDPSLFDPRAPVLAYHPYQMQLEGIGISAGKPTFPGCIGRNPQGDPLYKLGTMSFDMFRPTELVVSVQGTFCLIDGVDRNNLQEMQNVPKNLLNDVRHGINPVRHYNIVTPFTIEPYQPEFGENSPNKGVEQPIHGVMTTYGYILPYPTGNRFSVWFTGGSLEVDNHKNEKWFQIFDKKAAPRRTAFETGKVLAAKLLMGACVNDEMDQHGTLKYTLTRPVASYIDLVYLDNSLQVLRGSSGTVYVHVRLPGGSGAVHQSTYSDQLLPAPVDPLGSNNLSPTHRFLL